MLIRSQDKKLIANMKKIKNMAVYEYEKKKDCEGNEIIVRDCGYGKINPNIFILKTENVCLGEYSTEEKAIKVLDEIFDEYRLSKYTDYIYDTSAQASIPMVVTHNAVYQMPQDEEVKI